MKKAKRKQPARKTAQPTVARKRRARKEPTTAQAPTVHAKPPEVPSKKDLVIGLLQREGGATLDALMTATGWQKHSVRGFLSGALRKKLGLTVERVSGEGTGMRYHIPPPA